MGSSLDPATATLMVWGLCAGASVALPVGMNFFSSIVENPFAVFLVAVVLCVGLVYAAWSLVFARVQRRRWELGFFTLGLFGTIVDFWLAFSTDFLREINGKQALVFAGIPKGLADFIPGMGTSDDAVEAAGNLLSGEMFSFLTFYLENGEKYLKTPHGVAINYWDFFVHGGLYIFMIHSILSGRNWRSLGLLWFGSIGYSMVVLLGGALSGQYSDQVHWSILLNVPFVLLPVVILGKILDGEADGETEEDLAEAAAEEGSVESIDTPIWTRMWDFLNVILCVLSSLAMLARACVALGSSNAFLQFTVFGDRYMFDQTGFSIVHVLSQAYLIVPGVLFCVAVLIGPSSHQRVRLAASVAQILFGALLQGSAAHIIGGFHKYTDDHVKAVWGLEYVVGVFLLLTVAPLIGISRVYGHGTGHWIVAPMELPTVGGVKVQIPFTEKSK